MGGNTMKVGQKKYQKNYCNDKISEYIEIYKLMNECFDENQADEHDNFSKDYVEYSTMIEYIMEHTNGRYSVRKLEKILKEFEV